MWSGLIISIVTITGCTLFIKRVLHKQKSNGSQRLPAGTHVIISGGSKGIGKSLAKKYAELGTHVTIIARNQTDLDAAKKEIEKTRRNPNVQTVRAVSLDLTKVTFPDNSKSDISEAHRELVERIVGDHERCDILINCCGSSIPARFEDISQQQFRYMMDVNYFSAVNLTRVLLPIMKNRSLQNGNKQAGTGHMHIAFVSSMCGLLSFFGFSAYSASKFALVGLAEALHMELKPFDIGVTVAFPPDTDTPGFETENKIKPSLTAKISESGNLYGADEVAASIVADIRAKQFCSTIGFENNCVLTALNTFMPRTSFLTVLAESLVAGPLKITGYFIVRSWYKLLDEAAPNEIISAELAKSQE